MQLYNKSYVIGQVLSPQPTSSFFHFFLRNVLADLGPLLFFIIYMLESACQLQEKRLY